MFFVQIFDAEKENSAAYRFNKGYRFPSLYKREQLIEPQIGNLHSQKSGLARLSAAMVTLLCSI
jgi:hypothetical protein